MRNKICIITVMCALILTVLGLNHHYTNIVSAQEIYSCASGMVVLEGNTNTVLYESNKDMRLPMASTTKIITAIVAIENCNDLDKKFRVSDKSIGIEGTSIYLKNGEELTMRELLYGLILASGNDCAVAIAEYFESVETFINMMNDLCTKLNLKNTHFDNPHGLDSDSHYTSAYDLAVMTSYALKNDTFREIVSTKRMVIDSTGLYQARYLKHKNRLLFEDDNCIGVKTGFTDNAGRCLVNAYDDGGMQVISVVLNCQPMFEECKRLTELAYDNYIMKEFVTPYNFVSDIEIMDSNKTEVGVITISGYSRPILISEENNYKVKYNIPNKLYAPIGLNEVVGTVEVYYNDELIYQDDLITIENADNNNLKYLFDNIIEKWF